MGNPKRHLNPMELISMHRQLGHSAILIAVDIQYQSNINFAIHQKPSA